MKTTYIAEIQTGERVLAYGRASTKRVALARAAAVLQKSDPKRNAWSGVNIKFTKVENAE